MCIATDKLVNQQQATYNLNHTRTHAQTHTHTTLANTHTHTVTHTHTHAHTRARAHTYTHTLYLFQFQCVVFPDDCLGHLVPPSTWQPKGDLLTTTTQVINAHTQRAHMYARTALMRYPLP